MVAHEPSDHDPLRAHLAVELNLDANGVVSPWHATLASAIAFTLGVVLPLFAIPLPPEAVRVPVTFVAELFALAVTGWLGASIGGGSRFRAASRVIIGGALALGAIFAIGSLLGASGSAG